MRMRLPILPAALVVLSIALAGCGPNEEAASPAEQEALLPELPAPKAPSTLWNTYHGRASLDGSVDTALPGELTPLWRFMAGAPVLTTPVAGGGRIYFVNSKGRLFAVDAQGKELWSRVIPREAEDRWSPTEELFDAPLAYFCKTVLAGSVDGIVFALDAATGETRWQTDLDGTILGTPNVLCSGTDEDSCDAGRVFVIEQSDGVLVCLDFPTGEVAWGAEGVGRCDGSPGVGGEVIAFGSCASAIHLFSAKDGKLLREVAIDDDAQVAGGVVVNGDAIFSGSRSGKVLQVNVKTGGIAWANTDCDAEIFSTPAVNADWVVFGAEDENVYAINRAMGQLKWTVAAGGLPKSPVIAGDKVVVSADGTLHLMRLDDGHKLWSHEISDEITAPAIVGEFVVVGCDDGTVAAFG
jgi:outer membrane protein assembly factor BamB